MAACTWKHYRLRADRDQVASIIDRLGRGFGVSLVDRAIHAARRRIWRHCGGWPRRPLFHWIISRDENSGFLGPRLPAESEDAILLAEAGVVRLITPDRTAGRVSEIGGRPYTLTKKLKFYPRRSFQRWDYHGRYCTWWPYKEDTGDKRWPYQAVGCLAIFSLGYSSDRQPIPNDDHDNYYRFLSVFYQASCLLLKDSCLRYYLRYLVPC